MAKKSKQETVQQYLTSIHKVCSDTDCATSVIELSPGKVLDGASFYIVYKAKGIHKDEVLGALAEALYSEG